MKGKIKTKTAFIVVSGFSIAGAGEMCYNAFLKSKNKITSGVKILGICSLHAYALKALYFDTMGKEDKGDE